MKFVFSSVIEASCSEVFAFHERDDALGLLLPPWETFRRLEPAKSLEVGAVAKLEQRVGPFWVRIVAEHTGYEKDALFVDEMRRGPFRYFRHEHRFLPDPAGCKLEDFIEYEPPLWVLGRLAAPLVVVPRLRKMFEYRHRVTRDHVLGLERADGSEPTR